MKRNGLTLKENTESLNVARVALMGVFALGCASEPASASPNVQGDASVTDTPPSYCWLQIESVYGEGKGIGFVSRSGVTSFSLAPRGDGCHEQLSRATTPVYRDDMPTYTFPARVCLYNIGPVDNCVNTQFTYGPGGAYDAGSFKSVLNVGPIHFSEFRGLPEYWQAIDQRVSIEITGNGLESLHASGDINVDWSRPEVTNVTAAINGTNAVVDFTTSEPIAWAITIPGENVPNNPQLSCSGNSSCPRSGDFCIFQSCVPQPWGGAAYTSGHHTATIPFRTSRRGPFTGTFRVRDLGGHEDTQAVEIQ